MEIKITKYEHLTLLALLEQAMEDDDCYSKEQLDEFKKLYIKLAKVLDV